MNDQDILQAITECVNAETGNTTTPILSETVASEVVGWDSIAHVGVIIAIEEKFEIEFTEEEISGLANVGAIIKCVRDYLNQK